MADPIPSRPLCDLGLCSRKLPAAPPGANSAHQLGLPSHYGIMLHPTKSTGNSGIDSSCTILFLLFSLSLVEVMRQKKVLVTTYLGQVSGSIEAPDLEQSPRPIATDSRSIPILTLSDFTL